MGLKEEWRISCSCKFGTKYIAYVKSVDCLESFSRRVRHCRRKGGRAVLEGRSFGSKSTDSQFGRVLAL